MQACTAALVEFLEDRAQSIDTGAIGAAQTLVLDVLGVAVAGSVTPEGQSIARVMTGTRRNGDIVVPGVAGRYDSATAALVFGTAAYSIGLTDTHSMSITHPGPSVVATALTLGQETHASGQDVLRAVVLGCEAIVRIGAVVNPSHRRRGFHPTATCNPFGTAIAGSRLLGSDRQHTLWALGLAGSMSGGLYEFRQDGSMLMALHGGLPAANGVTAAYLAADGFTGPTTVLEGPEGFFRAFADTIQPELLLETRDRFGVEELSLRPYCACRYAHAAIDAIERIWLARGRVEPDKIASVTVYTHKIAVEQETEPVSVVGARLSTRFNVALALVHGPRLSEVTVADLKDPDIAASAAKVTVIEDPALTAIFPRYWSCRVQIEIDDGEVLEMQVDSPLGDPENPMSSDAVDRKFNVLAGSVIGDPKAGELLAAVRSLHQAPDLSRITAAMASSGVLA